MTGPAAPEHTGKSNSLDGDVAWAAANVGSANNRIADEENVADFRCGIISTFFEKYEVHFMHGSEAEASFVA